MRPTDPAPIILPVADRLECRDMRWGWKVPWAKGPLVHARSKTLTTLPAFKPHLASRCLIITLSFREGGARFHRTGREVFSLAGLWREEEGIPRFVMLNITPNASVAPYHQRMPLLRREAQYTDWMRGDWERVLADPDQRPLEIFQLQPELF